MPFIFIMWYEVNSDWIRLILSAAHLKHKGQNRKTRRRRKNSDSKHNISWYFTSFYRGLLLIISNAANDKSIDAPSIVRVLPLRTSLEHISSPFMDPTLHVPRRRCSVVGSPTERRILSLRATYAINFPLLISDLSTQHYSDNRHTLDGWCMQVMSRQRDPEKLLHLVHHWIALEKALVPPKTIKHMRIINWWLIKITNITLPHRKTLATGCNSFANSPQCGWRGSPYEWVAFI